MGLGVSPLSRGGLLGPWWHVPNCRGVCGGCAGVSLAMLALPHVAGWAEGTLCVPVWLGWLVETPPACPCPAGGTREQRACCPHLAG